MMWTLLHLAVALTSVTSAFSASSPPSGAITIGPGGTYSTIAAGLADNSSSTYFIYAGTYLEQVHITRANIKIYGQTCDTLTYTHNEVNIWNSLNSTVAGSDDASGTVRVAASGVALYNLNIANTFGAGTQAIALSVQSSNFGGYGLNLTGYQDTLYANYGPEFISHSLIVGAVDYIFGQHGSVWITKSLIDSVGSGCITASGRSSDDANYFVIDSSIIEGSSGVTAYLGRPWRDYARVVFQYCYLGSVVPAVGWSEWSSTTPNTDNVTFAEYKNIGPGANGTRASFATEPSAPINISTVLGSSYTSWVDSRYL
ncbi:carbohydrate esterase family 8 protein [Clavulina sp. PMI_390]|nr:carbohydrate esterase family 8 protein [Clavulina sp. PMI_390]